MYERFTDRARKTMQLANQASQLFNHEYIGTEHVLLGLIKEGSGVAANVLKNLNVDLRKIRLEVEKLVQRGPEIVSMGKLPQTPRAKKVIEYSMDEARNLGHNYVGTEHILLGLLREQEGVAAQVLMNLGLKLEDVREEVLNLLGYGMEGGEGGGGGESGGRGAMGSASGGSSEKESGSSSSSNKSKTPALDSFGRDLTELAKQGKLDPAIGREKEVQQLMRTLCRRMKNNPVLIGEPGVGKTAIVEGFAQLVADGNVDDRLRDCRVLALDLAGMLAGTTYRGQLEQKIKSILKELKRAQKVIVFIDELHMIVAAGAVEGGSMDVANLLKPALGRGEFRCIGATTLEEYRKIEKDAALERRFHPIIVREPTDLETIAILQGLRDRYERFHKVKIHDEAIVAALELSKRYLSHRRQPDASIDLIDETSTMVALRNSIPRPPTGVDLEISSAMEQKEQAVAEMRFEDATILRDRIELLKKKKAEFLVETRVIVTADDVMNIVAEMTGVPVKRLTEVERKDLATLEDQLRATVIGQDSIVNSVARTIRRNRAGLADPNRPVGSFLFAGPTGVGKTLLAYSIAKLLFGSEEALIRIDMSEYTESHTSSRLIGSPPGYLGYGDGGQLTEKVRRQPYCVILLDEIEKAHPEVLSLFLQVLEDGHLTDSVGRRVNFRQSIMIMTSNLGASSDCEVPFLDSSSITGVTGENSCKAFPPGDQKKLRETRSALENTLSREFLNRVDEVLIFDFLDEAQMNKIFDLELEKISTRLNRTGVRLAISPAVRQYLMHIGMDRQMGARPLRRVLMTHLQDAIADSLLRGELEGKCIAGVDLKIQTSGVQIIITGHHQEPIFSPPPESLQKSTAPGSSVEINRSLSDGLRRLIDSISQRAKANDPNSMHSSDSVE